MQFSELEMSGRLLLAAVLGGFIGTDREKQLNGAAGMRTHSLVATSAALVMIVSIYGFMPVLEPGRIVLDPSRLAAQVVSGVGFLGAGLIIFRRSTVRGLTTAASIWAVATVGLACGSGLYIVAFVTTVIMWTIRSAMKKVEQKFFPQKKISRLHIEVANSGLTKEVSDRLHVDGLHISNMSIKHVKGKPNMIIKVETVTQEKLIVNLVNELQALPGVESVEYAGPALLLNTGEQEDERVD